MKLNFLKINIINKSKKSIQEVSIYYSIDGEILWRLMHMHDGHLLNIMMNISGEKFLDMITLRFIGTADIKHADNLFVVLRINYSS